MTISLASALPFPSVHFSQVRMVIKARLVAETAGILSLSCLNGRLTAGNSMLLPNGSSVLSQRVIANDGKLKRPWLLFDDRLPYHTY
jgi:hypothetical protein